MKTYIVIAIFSLSLLSCDKKEKASMQQRIDSLGSALIESKKIETTMNEIGVMLDSIDVTRHALNLKIEEGIAYTDYIKRLQDINANVKKLDNKITSLESGQKKSNLLIKRLKADLETKSKEIVTLQLEVANLREVNKRFMVSSLSMDSTLLSKDEVIKVKSSKISSLENEIKDINDKNQIKLANLYFDQASALEKAADRTKFAPHKKKETRREALELYKLSLSLGNKNAQTKIEELEKKIG